MVLLCGIMGFTLLIFFMYHLSMVRNDTTTNERMKRSDFMAYLKKNLKKAMDLEKKELADDKREDLRKKIQEMLKDYEKLENYRGKDSIGLKKNLKTIIYS